MCVSGRESSCSAPSVMGGLDVDPAFDDCSSRRPAKAPPRNPRRQWRLAVDVARRAERGPRFYRSPNDDGTPGDLDDRPELILALGGPEPGRNAAPAQQLAPAPVGLGPA